LDLCSAHAPWANSLRDVEELTPFAITTRYPGEDEVVTREEAVRAIEIADRVRTTVQEAIGRTRNAPPLSSNGRMRDAATEDSEA